MVDLEGGERAGLGEQAWTESTWEPTSELHGMLLEQAKQGHPAANYGDWRDFGSRSPFMDTRYAAFMAFSIPIESFGWAVI